MAQEHKYNSSTPLFSIVIPTYNHGHLIGRCLDSVVGQSCGDWEAIVVNNFSNDNTVEVVEGYHDSRIRLINFANNGIIAASRNKGISEARGEWICFLDSDDWWTPDKLEACLPYLDEYDMIYHRMQIYSEQTQQPTSEYTAAYSVPTPIYQHMLRLGNCCTNSSVVLRRSIIDTVGPITEDPAFVAVEDFDYWLRISRVTERFARINRTLGYYWIGSGSVSFSLKWFARQETLYAHHLANISDPVVCREIATRQAYRVARYYDIHYRNYNQAIPHYREALRTTDFQTRVKALIFLFKVHFNQACRYVFHRNCKSSI